MANEPMKLSDDPRQALREIAGYLITLDMRAERAVCEHEDPEGCQPRLSVRSYVKNDPSIIGYYQLTGWLQDLLGIADECERIAKQQEPKTDAVIARAQEMQRKAKYLDEEHNHDIASEVADAMKYVLTGDGDHCAILHMYEDAVEEEGEIPA